MMKEAIKEQVCTRCGHKWLPRTTSLPKACPHCNNRRWNKPKKELKMILELTPDTHDSDDVRFMLGKTYVGYGYKAKGGTTICVIRCPMCRRENYAPNVPTGVCSWCGFNPNP